MAMEQMEASGRCILHRPRIQALVEQGLTQPLLVLLAPTGFGKTQCMLNYASSHPCTHVWVHCNASDNLPDRFWLHLVRMLGRFYPTAIAELQALPFASGIYAFEAFLQVLEHHVCPQPKNVWIFDDYGSISNQQVKDFVGMLVDARVENLHIVLISNDLGRMESLAFMVSKSALIMTNQLRFQRSEIKAFYRLHGVDLSEQEIAAIEQYTEGWPLPLSLLASQRAMPSDSLWSNQRNVVLFLENMLEERYFRSYPEAQRRLLMNLSLVDQFNQSLVTDTASDEQTAKAVLDHPFLVQASAYNSLYFHRIYRDFLQEKAQALALQEVKTFWLQVAECQLEYGEPLNAVASFEKAGKPLQMLLAMRWAMTAHVHLNEKTAALFLQLIDQLTEAQRKQYPLADSIKAQILLCVYRLDEAQTVLCQLENRLLQSQAEDDRALLAEVFIQHSLLRMLQAKDDFGLYYQKAEPFLTLDTFASSRGDMRVNNHFSFYLPDNKKGAKQRIETAILRDVPWFVQETGGSLAGMPQIFSAECAFLGLQMKAAQQKTYRGIYAAAANHQHDLVCNGYAMLTWYYIKMHNYKRIPKSVRMLEESSSAAIGYGRIFIVYANHLASMGEFAKLVGMLEQMKLLPQYQFITQESIYLNLLLAVGYQGLNQSQPALHQLWLAYDACHQNKLIAPFVEVETPMLSLLQTAKQQTAYAFDPAWIAQIETECTAYCKRINAVRVAYHKQNPKKAVKNNPLSKRELAVLQAIARGLTREEVAQEQYISMNTVKSTISSIFNKLNAKNKADAVSIALAKGYIEGHTQED